MDDIYIIYIYVYIYSYISIYLSIYLSTYLSIYLCLHYKIHIYLLFHVSKPRFPPCTNRATLIEIVRRELDAKLLQNAIGVQTSGRDGFQREHQPTKTKKNTKKNNGVNIIANHCDEFPSNSHTLRWFKVFF